MTTTTKKPGRPTNTARITELASKVDSMADTVNSLAEIVTTLAKRPDTSRKAKVADDAAEKPTKKAKKGRKRTKGAETTEERKTVLLEAYDADGECSSRYVLTGAARFIGERLTKQIYATTLNGGTIMFRPLEHGETFEEIHYNG